MECFLKSSVSVLIRLKIVIICADKSLLETRLPNIVIDYVCGS